ncbi:S41 family peptidase [Pararhodonellum marinum]|uniref:S41 family peptidase n=1 Tax=Pararhodonellum marinum TaxID=2755358 RepID=UPI00188ECDDC|nr:S41 family peptidase [Pararhodonellum marinum]
MIRYRYISLFFCLMFFQAVQSQDAKPYLMQPDVQGDQVVFVAEGDIWKVMLRGGEAARLTTHAGEESSPKISPDGKWVAYAASYEGPTEVYIIPVSGGIPKRLTYEASPSIPTAWKSANELAYVTGQYATAPRLNTVTVNISTGEKTILPLEMAAEGSFSTDGQTYYFVRPTFHNNVTKRYEGGTARQIWKYSAGEEEAVKLTKDYKGEDHHPVFHQGRVYFLSARDGIMNVWSMTESGDGLKQHTHEKSFDVREAAFSAEQMVYRVGADLYRMNLLDGQREPIQVHLVSDFDQMREKWVTDPEKSISSASVSNDGKNVVLTARGRAFVLPVKEGRTVRLDRKDGVRFRDAVFSNDGSEVLVFSDASGEFELYEYNSLGLDKGKPLTSGGQILRFDPVPSPDDNKIAFRDLKQQIWILNKISRKIIQVTESEESVSSVMTWSPDSEWLAYGQAASNGFMQLFLFKVSDQKRIPLTSDRANSLNPQWSPDGEWIYFLSDRNFQSRINSPWGTRQPEPFWEKQMKIYHISLQKDLVSPFHFNHELKQEPKKQEGDVKVTVDEEGLMERLREVPVPAGNYRNLLVTEKALFYQEVGPGMAIYSNQMPSPTGEKTPIKYIPISSKAEQKVFVDDVKSFSSSLNKKHILFTVGSNHYVAELKDSPLGDLTPYKLDLSKWQFSINPKEDWIQLYRDAWRMERDYFYDANMHGIDWDKMYKKYLTLATRVTTRRELSDVMGELIGELSVLHTSVGGGDLRTGSDQVDLAFLGARITRSSSPKGFRIVHIYQSDPDYPDEMSPLSHPDVNLNEGDVITHVDGIDVMEVPDIHQLLRGKAGQQVRLSTLNSSGIKNADRILKPMTAGAEANLRYNEWEYSRKLQTEAASDGQIGYVHLRAMTANDIGQWYRDFYPQYKKSGLIIDVRLNRGGNIDSFILEKLMREAFFYWKSRSGAPYWNMQYAFRGHLVLLVDEFTASDGEAFAEGFRRLELGQAIGARTWGGEVWLSGVNTLSDGGIARAPMMGVYGEEGEWLIEGEGFIPDIEVINLPKATFDGKDAQLEAAIKHLQELIQKDPRPVPDPPAYPDKSFGNKRE